MSEVRITPIPTNNKLNPPTEFHCFIHRDECLVDYICYEQVAVALGGYNLPLFEEGLSPSSF